MKVIVAVRLIFSRGDVFHNNVLPCFRLYPLPYHIGQEDEDQQHRADGDRYVGSGRVLHPVGDVAEQRKFENDLADEVIASPTLIFSGISSMS